VPIRSTALAAVAALAVTAALLSPAAAFAGPSDHPSRPGSASGSAGARTSTAKPVAENDESDRRDGPKNSTVRGDMVFPDRHVVKGPRKSTTKGNGVDVSVTPAATPAHEVHRVWVSIADVTASTTDNHFTLDDLSEANVTAAIQKVSDYWSEESGGAVTFVLAGYETDTVNQTSTCDPDAAWDSLAASAFPEHSNNGNWYGTNDHLLILTREYNCPGSGHGAFGSVGGSGDPADLLGGGIVISGEGVDDQAGQDQQGVPVLLHEFGHNLGFGHADSAICLSATQYDAPIWAYAYEAENTSCPTEPYGDEQDIMGYNYPLAHTHLGSLRRIQMGWLNGSFTNASSVDTSTVVHPLDDSAGNRALRVTDPRTGDVYVVEYRAEQGEDATSEEFVYQRTKDTDGWLHLYDGPGASTFAKWTYDTPLETGGVRVERLIDMSTDRGYGYSETVVPSIGITRSKAGTADGPYNRNSHLEAGASFTSYSGGFTITVDSLSEADGAAISYVAHDANVTTTTLARTSPTSAQTYGSTHRVSFEAQADSTDGVSHSGHIEFAADGQTIASVVPEQGFAEFTLPTDLEAGSRAITASFVPDDEYARLSTSQPIAVTVSKASSVSRASLADATIRSNKHAQVKVRVAASGVAGVAGHVTVSANGHRVSSHLITSDDDGYLVLSLPKLHTGSYAITAVYSGDANVKSSTAAILRLKVRH
jgi:hypothetical protein